MSELATVAPDLAKLLAEVVADKQNPADYIVKVCDISRAQLASLVDANEFDEIKALKEGAESLRIFAMSRRLGKETELAAAELVRRTERALGIAMRKGKAAGLIGTTSEGHLHRKGAPKQAAHKRSPIEFFDNHREKTLAYQYADATDEEFDAAIAAAKQERVLSGSNLVRKLKPSHPLARREADKPGRNRRPINEAAKDLGWALRKTADQVHDMVLIDDRYRANRRSVVLHLHSHVAHAIAVLQKAIEKLGEDKNDRAS